MNGEANLTWIILISAVVFIYLTGKAIINYYYNEGIKKGLDIAEEIILKGKIK
jgi:hypothetical protein